MKFDVNDVYAVQLSSASYEEYQVCRMFVKMERENRFGDIYSLVSRIDMFHDYVKAIGLKKINPNVSFCLGAFLKEHGVEETEIDLKIVEDMDSFMRNESITKDEMEKRIGAVYAEFVNEAKECTNFRNSMTDLIN